MYIKSLQTKWEEKVIIQRENGIDLLKILIYKPYDVLHLKIVKHYALLFITTAFLSPLKVH